MKRRYLSWAVGAIFIVVGVASLGAATYKGTVISVSGDVAKVAMEGDVMPPNGAAAAAEIFFKMPGSDDEISVATGSALKIDMGDMLVKIDEATGTVEKGHLVRFSSPRTSTLDSSPSAPSTPPSAAPSVTTPSVPALSPTTTLTPKKENGMTAKEPPHVAQMASKIVTFDELPAGPISDDEFSIHGIRLVKGKGTPAVFDSEPNMVLPRPCQKVLMVGDVHVTSVTIVLDPPVNRFSLYRIGTRGGASTPTWKMMAYNKRGEVLGSTGETHGLPSQPMSFGIDAEDIARVVISTDNRHGSGTWATWSSLPIAGFGFDR